MSDSMTPARLAEIRARLEAATGDLQHGYVTDGDGGLIEDEGQIFICDDDDAEGEINIDHPAAQAWSALIFNAPDDLRDLLAEVDRLRTALRFYALPEHWMALTSAPDSPRVTWVARTHLDSSADGYSTARAALAPAGTTEGGDGR